MDFERCRLNMFVVGLCALSILLSTVHADVPVKENHDELTDSNDSAEETHDSIERRQDSGGFDFMRYFVGNNQQQAQQQVQQANHGQQQLRQAQPVATQQLASQQQLSQQQQLQQQLQQLQLLQALQQQQAARSSEVYQEPSNTPQHQPQQQAVVNRDGGYGSVGIGGGYQQPKQIGISIGGNRRPGLQIGNILTLLPRIFNILSAGGKVMFGLELGNNFYFGPVGAKPLYG